ncbi:MAG: NUDIX hydrolase [Burkholderiales bacterium]|nr:NUDIX hydrolase [Burkholderiales bacterium]OUT77639.1 MAG: NUDIX hydrolase [Betaproteobacteria bacterium TMED22]|tara:strand:- start:11323 stop:11763 length:441 start_codon:yes stop_codon:yes gene_type:complete
MVWKPNVTVAAIVERDGRFLLVEENTSQGVRLNQPAGHLESGETLIGAIKREVLEETAYIFEPKFTTGIQLWTKGPNDTTFLRVVFTGIVGQFFEERQLDTGIIQTVWLTPKEIMNAKHKLRSPLVLSCVTDYLSGHIFPLSVIRP